ncbi:MAG: 50S ribosomal protein L10 [Candidatus Paceibacterota bacterium]|nr:MAG: 50S ribosomal protein L10 [Candidatus Paceibacterota bacterium]
MAITKQKKSQVLEGLKNVFSSGAEVIFTNFHGLNVSETTSLRKKFKEAGVSYQVAKKTLVKKALADSGFGETPEFQGELSIVHALGVEPLEAGRQANSIQKEFEGKFSIIGGIFEGKILGKEEMLALARIPSKKILYSQFVNLINSPIQRLAISLNQIAEKKS